MTTADLIATAEALRIARETLLTTADRLAAMERLLLRCREMCRSDGVTLGPLARALVAEIENALGETR